MLLFLVNAFRGARRIDEQHDDELIDAMRRRREALTGGSHPLPPLRHGETAEPLPPLAGEESTRRSA